ncbi:proline-rich receptor-like protein kinase PERK10 [Triticum aestivum]|uniref:proline-rich receptor-like protein kinase PERK10 n=1 Tax=Triticum aestivum TaxID=4565 RepID=UPI001D013D26|nr:proline-rich receptor-like protein kinase PERK10 [Triticum aestivum]
MDGWMEKELTSQRSVWSKEQRARSWARAKGPETEAGRAGDAIRCDASRSDGGGGAWRMRMRGDEAGPYFVPIKSSHVRESTDEHTPKSRSKGSPRASQGLPAAFLALDREEPGLPSASSPHRAGRPPTTRDQAPQADEPLPSLRNHTPWLELHAPPSSPRCRSNNSSSPSPGTAPPLPTTFGSRRRRPADALPPSVRLQRPPASPAPAPPQAALLSVLAVAAIPCARLCSPAASDRDIPVPVDRIGQLRGPRQTQLPPLQLLGRAHGRHSATGRQWRRQRPPGSYSGRSFIGECKKTGEWERSLLCSGLGFGVASFAPPGWRRPEGGSNDDDATPPLRL